MAAIGKLGWEFERLVCRRFLTCPEPGRTQAFPISEPEAGQAAVRPEFVFLGRSWYAREAAGSWLKWYSNRFSILVLGAFLGSSAKSNLM